MQSSKKHLEHHYQPKAKDTYNAECRIALEAFLESKRKITEDYKNKSNILHKGATNTHNTLSRQLTEPLREALYHDSYRILARIIGLNGITSDVGTFVSIDSVYNAVQPLISYPDLYTELERQHKKKEFSALFSDFYMQSPEQSAELKEALQSPDLHNYGEPIWYKSPWSRAFSIFMTSIHGFQDHVHNVMAKHNIRLAKEHGWDSMPLTKMHLYSSSNIGGSPLDNTPWGIVSKEYRDIQSIASAAYYKREAQLKKECDDALQEVRRVYETALEEAEKYLAEKLHPEDELDWIDLNVAIIAESESFSGEDIEPLQSVKEKSKPEKNIKLQTDHNKFFTPSPKPKLTTIYEVQAENQNESTGESDEDLEICAIFTSSLSVKEISAYRK